MSEAAVLDDTWIDFTINGKTTRVEAFEALQVLGEIDQRHKDDANECAACGAIAGASSVCPSCGGKQLRATRSYRDDLVATLAKEFDFGTMSGRTALSVYDRIVGVAESKKNGNTTTPESLGGTESTVLALGPPAKEPG